MDKDLETLVQLNGITFTSRSHNADGWLCFCGITGAWHASREDAAKEALLHLKSVHNMGVQVIEVPVEIAQTIVDWWRSANEAPGGCSSLEAIQGMRDAVYELHTILKANT